MIKIARKLQEDARTMRFEGPISRVDAIECTRAIKANAKEQNAQKRPVGALNAISDNRNYKTYYRAACEFHERNNPPRLDADNGAAYWDQVCADITETSNRHGNDPFLMDLLASVFEELEREYRTLQEVI